MFARAKELNETTVREIREAGLYKEERVITTPQVRRDRRRRAAR